nr:hypothetical protein Iba_chr10eCG12340 [Ipomoea batatas]
MNRIHLVVLPRFVLRTTPTNFSSSVRSEPEKPILVRYSDRSHPAYCITKGKSPLEASIVQAICAQTCGIHMSLSMLPLGKDCNRAIAFAASLYDCNAPAAVMGFNRETSPNPKAFCNAAALGLVKMVLISVPIPRTGWSPTLGTAWLTMVQEGYVLQDKERVYSSALKVVVQIHELHTINSTLSLLISSIND